MMEDNCGPSAPQLTYQEAMLQLDNTIGLAAPPDIVKVDQLEELYRDLLGHRQSGPAGRTVSGSARGV